MGGVDATFDKAELASLLVGHLSTLSEKLRVMDALTDRIGFLAEVRDYAIITLIVVI